MLEERGSARPRGIGTAVARAGSLFELSGQLNPANLVDA
jgi:hypothetical protein